VAGAIAWIPRPRARNVRPHAESPRGHRPNLAMIRSDTRFQLLTLLVLFLIAVLPLETYFQRKQGAESEHLLGMAWTIVLIGAVGYRWAGRLATTRIAMGATIAVLAVVGVVFGTNYESGYGHIPRVVDHYVYGGIVPPDVVALHGQGKKLLVRWGDMNV